MMEIISEEEISAEDAKKIMQKRKKEREVVYEQKICIDYLEKISKLTDAQLKNLKEELGKIAILKPRHIALILNILPDTEEEVQMLFAKERTNLKKEEMKQIVEAVKKIVKK